MSNAGADHAGQSIWMRALFMLLFAILYSIAEIVVVVVAACTERTASNCNCRSLVPR